MSRRPFVHPALVRGRLRGPVLRGVRLGLVLAVAGLALTAHDTLAAGQRPVPGDIPSGPLFEEPGDCVDLAWARVCIIPDFPFIMIRIL